ncbi:MAG: ABC transporter substrate-binding protein [Hyphomonadaceae bacterium]|jgi:peptide/nickel transport system substrate-binding protein|nr:ABC transporter substrate-binding protein [Hyphomonadaceae bacterium]
MSTRRAFALAFLLVSGLATGLASNAVLGPATKTPKTVKFALQGGLNSLDPYTLNESVTLGLLANVMEGLIRRNENMQIIPGLAERWDVLSPTHWRFHLRKGVTFHDGSPFTADDVVFSANRARGPGSQLKTRIPADARVEKVDDHTVDFVLASPNPILHYEWETWFIVSKAWSEANGATKAQPATANALSPFALKANGTGPFAVVSHEPGVKTVFRPNPRWWGKTKHNIDEVVFQTVHSDSTRVAALLSGELDLIDPVPLQDIARIKEGAKTTVLSAPELRTLFLNMDSMHEELKYANVKGRNPFKDARVRRAFYQAIDIEAITTKVMRGMATPAALIISPLLFSGADKLQRWPYDVAAAKRLMVEAGYAEGFELVMDCPNDRYVNDEQICQAVAAMLRRIDVKVALNLLPKAQYFEKVSPPRYDSSFNLLGWTPGSLDSWSVLANLVVCRDAHGRGGTFNFGGYCNPRVDELARKILVEPDMAKRNAMIGEAFGLLHADAGVIPLHQPALAWGVSRNLQVTQRADGHIRFQWMQKL